MAFFITKSDPLKENIASVLSKCEYGKNYQSVFAQVYNFLIQYPQFELTAENFTYNNLRSGSKLAFLRGAMILTIDTQQHEVPLHFVLISGFPGVAPKAFLTMDNDSEIIEDNPFILK